jgi:hypothetical protein
MDPIHPYRPRVSRETRLLLVTALIATVALWVLARVRFPDQPAPQNLVQPLLTQLTPRPTFADLASQLAALRPRLEPLLVGAPGGATGLRVRDDFAAAWFDPTRAGTWKSDAVLRRDPVSGLALVRADPAGSFTPPIWTPEPSGPRYFISAVHTAADVSLKPVYVAWLRPADSPRWPGEEWRLAPDAGLSTGSFLFTADAALAGLVVDDDMGHLLVPGTAVLAGAARLFEGEPETPAYIGVTVQRLTPALARATGAASGLVATWVDPRGPASGMLQPGDVIERVNGTNVTSTDDWDVQTARLRADDTVLIDILDEQGPREVGIIAAAPRSSGRASLGLTLRSLPGIGVEVVRTDPGSSSDRSGLAPGDVITRAGNVEAPTIAQVRSLFDKSRDKGLIVAVTRGDRRLVTALEQ